MHICPPLVHPHRTPMRSDHEARRPRLRKEEELRARCLASGGVRAPSTLATTPRFRASGTDLQVEGERTAYAHGCAQRAGGTTQRRHEAAPGLSPDPRQFRSQFPVAGRSAPRAAARNLVYTTNPAARRKASSVHVHVTAARQQPAGLSPFARNRGMSLTRSSVPVS